METPAVLFLPSRGFIIDLDGAPAGLAEQLEASGVAAMAARTVDGLYVEPAHSLAAVLRALEEAGARMRTLRRAGGSGAWERTVRPAREADSRLRNHLSACWLPTLPAA
jgi:hypothetical protein